MDSTLIIVGTAVVLVVIVLLVPVFQKAREIELTETNDKKPNRMQSTASTDAKASSKSDVVDKLAAPFAEQIEDLLKARLEADEYLSQFTIDLGTAPDGSLEIWVNGEMYTDVKSLPDARLRQAFKEAIEQWDKG